MLVEVLTTNLATAILPQFLNESMPFSATALPRDHSAATCNNNDQVTRDAPEMLADSPAHSLM